MYTLFKLSDKLGLMPTVLGVIISLAFEMYATAAVIDALRYFPRIAAVISITLMAVTGLSGLVGFWLVADRVDFWRRGYQVKRISEIDWVYEERSSTSEERILPYVRKERGEGYPAPCTIRIFDTEEWESDAPLWARGRRREIIERIVNCHGASRGVEVLIEKLELREAEAMTFRESI
jgi:hypothetical protein